jgi:hypothetical protein
MADDKDDNGIVLTEQQKRRRRARSIAIALVLGALVLLFYVVTIVKLGPGVFHRPL